MRIDQYTIPRVEGDPEDAELAVFYFGPQGAGGVDETLQRWADSFDQGSALKAKRSSGSTRAGTLDEVEVSGALALSRTMGGMTPGDGGDNRKASLLGAVLQTTDGPYYFKLQGPVRTVAASALAFRTMLDSCSVIVPAP